MKRREWENAAGLCLCDATTASCRTTTVKASKAKTLARKRCNSKGPCQGVSGRAVGTGTRADPLVNAADCGTDAKEDVRLPNRRDKSKDLHEDQRAVPRDRDLCDCQGASNAPRSVPVGWSKASCPVGRRERARWSARRIPQHPLATCGTPDTRGSRPRSADATAFPRRTPPMTIPVAVFSVRRGSLSAPASA